MTPQSVDDGDPDAEPDGLGTEDVDVLGVAETTVAKVVGDGLFAFRSATLLTVSTLATVSSFSFSRLVSPDFILGAPLFGEIAGVDGVDAGRADVRLAVDGAGLPAGDPPELDVEPPAHISASEVE